MCRPTIKRAGPRAGRWQCTATVSTSAWLAMSPSIDGPVLRVACGRYELAVTSEDRKAELKRLTMETEQGTERSVCRACVHCYHSQHCVRPQRVCGMRRAGCDRRRAKLTTLPAVHWLPRLVGQPHQATQATPPEPPEPPATTTTTAVAVALQPRMLLAGPVQVNQHNPRHRRRHRVRSLPGQLALLQRGDNARKQPRMICCKQHWGCSVACAPAISSRV